MKAVIATLCAVMLGSGVWAQENHRVLVPGSETVDGSVFRLVMRVGATISLHAYPGDEQAVVIAKRTAQAPNVNWVAFAFRQPFFFSEAQVHGGQTNAGDVPTIAITKTVAREGEPFIVLAN